MWTSRASAGCCRTERRVAFHASTSTPHRACASSDSEAAALAAIATKSKCKPGRKSKLGNRGVRRNRGVKRISAVKHSECDDPPDAPSPGRRVRAGRGDEARGGWRAHGGWAARTQRRRQHGLARNREQIHLWPGRASEEQACFVRETASSSPLSRPARMLAATSGSPFTFLTVPPPSFRAPPPSLSPRPRSPAFRSGGWVWSLALGAAGGVGGCWLSGSATLIKVFL